MRWFGRRKLRVEAARCADEIAQYKAELNGLLAEQNKLAEVSRREVVRMMADVISGEIVGRPLRPGD